MQWTIIHKLTIIFDARDRIMWYACLQIIILLCHLIYIYVFWTWMWMLCLCLELEVTCRPHLGLDVVMSGLVIIPDWILNDAVHFFGKSHVHAVWLQLPNLAWQLTVGRKVFTGSTVLEPWANSYLQYSNVCVYMFVFEARGSKWSVESWATGVCYTISAPHSQSDIQDTDDSGGDDGCCH